MTVRLSKSKAPLGRRFLRAVTKYWQLYLLFLPVLAWYIIFCYMPMGGVSIAFRKFSVIRGIAGSPWVGWDNFEKMFEAPMFWRAFRNTLIISFQNLLIGFPIPILFALLVNEIRNSAFKKTVQTISYLPHRLRCSSYRCYQGTPHQRSRSLINWGDCYENPRYSSRIGRE